MSKGCFRTQEKLLHANLQYPCRGAGEKRKKDRDEKVNSSSHYGKKEVMPMEHKFGGGGG